MSIFSIPSSHQHMDGAREDFAWKCFLGKSSQEENAWNFFCISVFSPGEHGELGVSWDEWDWDCLSRDWKTWDKQILLKVGKKLIQGQNIPGFFP